MGKVLKQGSNGEKGFCLGTRFVSTYGLLTTYVVAFFSIAVSTERFSLFSLYRYSKFTTKIIIACQLHFRSPARKGFRFLSQCATLAIIRAKANRNIAFFPARCLMKTFLSHTAQVRMSDRSLLGENIQIRRFTVMFNGKAM